MSRAACVNATWALIIVLLFATAAHAQGANVAATPAPIEREAVPPAPGSTEPPVSEPAPAPVPEPPPATIPEPPQAYGDARPEAAYAPVQPGLPQQQTVALGLAPLALHELTQLETERRSIGLGGPITLLSVGGGAALLFGLSAIAMAADPTAEGDDGVVLLATLGVAGLVIALVGTVMLTNRISRRKELDARIEELRQRLGPQAPPPVAGVLRIAATPATRLTLPF